jgi:hypothetical protein
VDTATDTGHLSRIGARRVLWSGVASVCLLAIASTIMLVPYTASGSRNRSSAVRALLDSCTGDSPVRGPMRH